MSHHCNIFIRHHEILHINYLINIKNILIKSKSYCLFFSFSKSSGKLSIVCSVNGFKDFTTKLFTFQIKLIEDTISHHILYVVIRLVHSLLKNVSCIIQEKVIVGLAHGLNTIQRSGNLCFVTI